MFQPRPTSQDQNWDWRNQAVRPQTPQQQPQYWTPGAYREFKSATQAVLFGALAYKAGVNRYNVGDVSKTEAVGHGLYCAFRWKVWIVQIITLFVSLVILANEYNHGYVSPAADRLFAWSMILGLGFFAIPIGYLQVVDESLFKHRFWYRFWHRVYGRFTDGPWLPFACASAVPFMIFVYWAS